jgi:hypothetical protein
MISSVHWLTRPKGGSRRKGRLWALDSSAEGDSCHFRALVQRARREISRSRESFSVDHRGHCRATVRPRTPSTGALHRSARVRGKRNRQILVAGYALGSLSMTSCIFRKLGLPSNQQDKRRVHAVLLPPRTEVLNRSRKRTGPGGLSSFRLLLPFGRTANHGWPQF